jgi:hypothetical protein
MANPAAAAQHQARGGDGATGRPAAERAQGTSIPRLLGAASAPATAQQPRAGGRSWRVAGSPLAGSRRGGRRARRAQAVAVSRGRGRAAPPGTRRCPVVRLLRRRAAGRAVAAPRLVRGCAAAAGFAMARVLRRCHVA